MEELRSKLKIVLEIERKKSQEAKFSSQAEKKETWVMVDEELNMKGEPVEEMTLSPAPKKARFGIFDGDSNYQKGATFMKSLLN